MNSHVQTRPLLGVSLVVLAMFGIGLIDNFIRLIAQDAGLWQFHFTRSLLACAILMALARLFGWRLQPRNWRAVAWRSFFFSTAMVLYFGAAGMMPVAQVGAGLFTSPIFVLLISWLFLGVRVGIWRVMAAVLGFAGVLLMLGTNLANLSVLSVIPVIAGMFYALNGIATRRWCAQESTQTLLMGLFVSLGLWGAMGLVFFTAFPASPEWAAQAPFFVRGWEVPTARFALWTMVQAFGALIAVFLLTRGYQLAEVTFVAVFEYSFLVFAAFWTWVIWGETLDAQSMVGMGGIALAGVIIALRSR